MHVVLKKDGWYCKIQKFVFGSDRSDFSNLCPFFWLTIFACLASPFVLIGHGFKYLFMGIAWVIIKFLDKMEGTVSYIDEEYCQPIYDRQLSRFAENLSDQDAYSLFHFMHGWSWWYDSEHSYKSESGIDSPRLSLGDKFRKLKPKARNRYIARFERWKELIGDAWTERIYTIREERTAKKAIEVEAEKQRVEIKYNLEREQKERKEQTKEETKRKRRQMYNEIIVYTKLLVWLPAGLVGLFVLYWLGRLGLVILEHWASITSATTSFFSTLISGIIFIIPWVLGSVLLATIFLGVSFVFLKLISKCDFSFISRVSIPGADKAKAVGSGMWSLTQKGLAPVGYTIETALKRLGPVLNKLGSIGRAIVTAVNAIVKAFKWARKFFAKVGSFFVEVAAFFVMYAKAVKTNYCPHIEWKEKG